VARQLARGDDAGEVESGRPLTVAEAIDGYERDLVGRGGDPGNARRLRFYVPPSLATKPVAMVSPREVRAFRDLLVAKGLTRATVNRTMKVFAAAMTLAANDDERISNRRAWRIPALSDATTARNVILTDEQVRAVVAASYQTGGDRFGTYIQTLAETGTRPIQARRLIVSDFEADHADGPRLQMPSSLKGKGKKRIERTPLPISGGLGVRLKAEAAGRADNEPLLLDDDGTSWTGAGHPKRFAAAAVSAKLPKNATAYSLRHSSVVRALLRGVPVRLVAAAHDTSAAQIEAHYSKYIAHPGADLMRGALLDVDAAPADNVVQLRTA
jgi:integrase